jgi:hypothetical protein
MACCLIPYIIISRLYIYRGLLKDEEIEHAWGALYLQFDVSRNIIPAINLALLFIRRVIIAASFIILNSSPIIQIILIQISCWIIVIFTVIYRPFKTKLVNLLQLINEICIASGYGLSGMFYFETSFSVNTHMMLILCCLSVSYVLHIGNILLSLVKFIYQKISNSRSPDDTTVKSSSNISGVASKNLFFN